MEPHSFQSVHTVKEIYRYHQDVKNVVWLQNYKENLSRTAPPPNVWIPWILSISPCLLKMCCQFCHTHDFGFVQEKIRYKFKLLTPGERLFLQFCIFIIHAEWILKGWRVGSVDKVFVGQGGNISSDTQSPQNAGWAWQHICKSTNHKILPS